MSNTNTPITYGSPKAFICAPITLAKEYFGGGSFAGGRILSTLGTSSNVIMLALLAFSGCCFGLVGSFVVSVSGGKIVSVEFIEPVEAEDARQSCTEVIENDARARQLY